MTRGSLLVIHGGGPTAVLNATLYGVVMEARGRYRRVLGARGGTEGALSGHFVDLSAPPQPVLDLLPVTPGSVIGSSRTPLDDDDLDRLVDVCGRHGIEAVLFTGGNGTMDTCARFHAASERAAATGGPQVSVVGVPKTMDNDLPATDHSPGFGSAARYLAATTAEIVADVRSLPIHICIVEAMGRNAGWLTAASALARRQGFGPDLVYGPELPFDTHAFLDDVQRLWDAKGHAVVVASEGLVDANRRPIVAPLFETGRSVYFGEVGSHLAELVVRELGIKARSEKPGLASRASIAWQSPTDRAEAERVGRSAVEALADGRDGVMVALQRREGPAYAVDVDLVDLTHLVLAERTLPDMYLSTDGVTDAYLDWLEPLVGPLPTFATL